MADHLRAVPGTLPDPPYPGHIKANGYNIEFDIQRIVASDTWAIASNNERAWLLRIWFEARRSVPDGSMQSDLAVFAARIGCTRQFLEAHKEVLLRGWKLHSDGRLYHEFITIAVLEMIARRRKAVHRVQRHRDKNQTDNHDVTRKQALTTVTRA